MTLRGIMAVHQRRIYMAWVEAPRGESEKSDVSRFLRSIKLPTGYAYDRRRGARPARDSGTWVKEPKASVDMIRLLAKLGVAAVVFIIGYLRLLSR